MKNSVQLGISRTGFGVLLLLLILLARVISPAQAVQLNVAHYDTRDGLPQVQVLTVNQCADGYIWLGTFSGLSRFNGRSFRHFYARDGLLSNYITDLETDSTRRLWVATNSGLCRLAERDRFDCVDHDGLTDAHIHALQAAGDTIWAAADSGLFRVREDRAEYIELPVGDGLPVVMSVTVNSSGDLWAGTEGGLFRLAEGDPARVEYVATDLAFQVTALAADEDGLWVGGDRGLYRWHDGELKSPDDPRLAGLDVHHLLLDEYGRLWVSAANGLFRIENGRVEHFGTGNRLVSDVIHSAFIDREGIVWLAHDSGLSKLLPSEFAAYTVDSGLLASFVRTLAEDEQGRLWLGTRAGVQVVPFEHDEWRIDESQTITSDDGLADERIYSIAFDSEGAAWLATSQGVVRWREGEGIIDVLEESDGLPSNRTRALLHDSSSRMWISTNLGTVLVENGDVTPVPVPELTAAYAMRIREDDHGRIWFATIQHGLVALDPGGEYRQWRGDEGLSNEMLWDVAPSDSGSVWVGSNGDGLFHVRANGEIRRYTSADGLADDFVWQVLVDDRGNVWAYTNRGLSRFDGDGFTSFGESDGLMHLEGAATASLQTRNGDLWFGSADGLMRHDPQGNVHGDVPPPVVIEEVLLGSQGVKPHERLPYRPGSLNIRFAGLSFVDEEAVTYRYRLRGVEPDWNEGSTGLVTYASLGGGDYVFEVKARNAHGVWSHQAASFPFSVEPPFWGTWWFWTVIALAGIMLIRAVVFLRERNIRARQAELEQLVDHRTAELSEANRRLEHASRTDPLTGLPNRRYLLDRIDHDVAETRRRYAERQAQDNRDMIFMMIDMDHFKSINDEYGHDAGDQVLCELSELISDQLRGSDDLIRWGGEEFLVVARHAEARLAPSIADRIVQAARTHRVTLKGSGAVVVPTCSIGIATYPFYPERPSLLDWEQVIQLADQAVYMAKHRGRDGWIWMRPGAFPGADDGEAFVEQVREQRSRLESEGHIRLESSFDRAPG
jgi:diguanylate cyclase (GGDEF)-like protein